MSLPRAFVIAASLLLVAGCTSANLLGPANDLQLVNESGTFEWQASTLEEVSQELRYTWTNPGTMANVNQSSSLASGSASLTVTDAAGTRVFFGSLGQNGTFSTSVGATGPWTVTVTLDKVTGDLNFRLETP